MLAETVDAVIGVDTHRDTHSASLVNAVGGELAIITIPATPTGYRQLLAWANQHAPGPRIVWAIEGSRSHGTGLTRALRKANQHLIEADRPQRVSRRPGGKSDPLDARRAARAALAGEHHATPRADGPREAARIVLTTRESAVQARTAAINALKALVTCASEDQREKLRGKTTAGLLAACAKLRPGSTPCPEERARRAAMARLARRIRDLTTEIRAADAELAVLTKAHVGQLLNCRGVGVLTAAQLWLSWSAPGRFRSEAAFAALAGASPIPASSGKTIRHRLNRGGDRALNCALHHIAITLERCDGPTRDYIARRTAEGKTRKEIRRCLKRYLARRLFRLLEHGPQPAAATT